MISRSDIKKRSYRLFEIAIVVSFVLHMVFGSVALYQHTTIGHLLQRLLKEEKEQKTAALSTTITIEKRTAPQPQPKPQPKPITAQAQPQPHPRKAEAAQPQVVKSVPRKAPVPRDQRQELAKIVPRAKEPTAVNKPQVVARIAVPKTNANSHTLTQAQINEMNERFSQTIDAARAANDPTHITSTPPPATMKRAHLDISGVNSMLTHGEGILTPVQATRAPVDGDPHGTCYYVNFSMNFSDGSLDAGPVYWPICYARRKDPFLNYFQHFPLPAPPPGWAPSPSEWPVIATHRVLRAYFPDRFPDADNGN